VQQSAEALAKADVEVLKIIFAFPKEKKAKKGEKNDQ